jgi:hypothetical protein
MLAGRVHEPLRPECFDVICAGQPLWRGPMPSTNGVGRDRGSAFVAVTRMLRESSLRVGWATVLEDDRRGRALRAAMAAIDVQVGAVTFASAASNLVIVDAVGGWSGVVSDRRDATPVDVPACWSSQVLMLSGLTPATSSLAAFCKEARRARRDGTVVVLDLSGSLRDWIGQDPRMIAMVIREADIVRCSFFDLAVIGTDAKAVRRSMKPSATLVLDDDRGATAIGAFGEVTVQASGGARATEVLAASYTAAICVEHARPRGLGETSSARWYRVLRGAQAQRRPRAGSPAAPTSPRGAT